VLIQVSWPICVSIRLISSSLDCVICVCHIGELSLVSLEVAVFVFPLILIEIYASNNVQEWHRVRDGLVFACSDATRSSRMTLVFIESLDFVRSQWSVILFRIFPVAESFKSMNLDSFYRDRSNVQIPCKVTDLFNSTQLRTLADAAFRVKKYATAFFYYELALESLDIASPLLQTADHSNFLLGRDYGNLQNLVESAAGLSDADLVDAFPTVAANLDPFDRKHFYNLATLAERNFQYELSLRYLDHFLSTTENSSTKYDLQLKQAALVKLYSVLNQCGLHYVADCIQKQGLSLFAIVFRKYTLMIISIKRWFKLFTCSELLE